MNFLVNFRLATEDLEVRVVRVVHKWEMDLESVPVAVSKARRARSLRRATVASAASKERVVDPRLRGKRRGHGWERSPRDEQLLEFVSLHGAMTQRQAAKWFYGGVEETARQRIQKMCESGLLETRVDVPWAGKVLIPTLDGQEVGLLNRDYSLPKKQLSLPRNLEHKLTVVDQALISRSRGVHVISERQIRMFEARPAEVVTAYLQAHGAKVSADGIEPGIVPSTLTIVSEVAGGFDVVGERETWLALPIRTPLDERMAQFSTQCSGLRFPDFVEITAEGELVAVEVEIANKADARMAAIVEGYREALPYLEQVRKGDGATGRRIRRRQFRRTRWVCSPEVMVELQGTHDFVSGEHSPGLIQTLMPEVFGKNFDWSNQGETRPVQVLPVSADDVGVQYALDQRNLEPQYRCEYQEWVRWRALWQEELTEAARARYPFTRWIRATGKLQDCRDLTRA